MDLYHFEIGLPVGFRLPNRVVSLLWTKHATVARETDRYGFIPEIPILNLGECQTIEVGIENKRVAKVVVRTELDDDNDIVFVLIPGQAKWTVKTVWINLRTDAHKTLNRSRYVH